MAGTARKWIRSSGGVAILETAEIDSALKTTLGRFVVAVDCRLRGRRICGPRQSMETTRTTSRSSAMVTIAPLCRFETRCTAGFIRHLNKESGVSQVEKGFPRGSVFSIIRAEELTDLDCDVCIDFPCLSLPLTAISVSASAREICAASETADVRTFKRQSDGDR
jgi:hypothetical protein